MGFQFSQMSAVFIISVRRQNSLDASVSVIGCEAGQSDKEQVRRARGVAWLPDCDWSGVDPLHTPQVQ